MKTNLLDKALFLLLAGMMALNFAACSDDDNENGTDALVMNQKKYLQNSLVRVDDAGNFMYRVCGAPLDADTTVLYIGVDNLAGAKNFFKQLFVPESTFNESGDNISCTLDEKGGTVTFAPADGSNGVLADVTFDGCNLVAVSSLHFMEKNAWPENSEYDFYNIGDFYMNDGTVIGRGRGTFLTADEKKACIGIVVAVGTRCMEYDRMLQTDHPNCKHGLVVAKYNAPRRLYPESYGVPGKLEETMSWSRYWIRTCDGGYTNTCNLRKEGAYCVEAVDNYPNDRGQKAPSCSSGWYLPANDGLLDMPVLLMNLQLRQIDGTTFDANTAYWTSTSEDYLIWHNNKAYAIEYDGGYGRFVSSKKNMSERCYVRPVLAF